MKEGLVLKSTGSWYLVKTDQGEEIQCRIKGKFRMKNIKTTNPITVGDRVKFEVTEDDKMTLTLILDTINQIQKSKDKNLEKGLER